MTDINSIFDIISKYTKNSKFLGYENQHISNNYYAPYPQTYEKCQPGSPHWYKMFGTSLASLTGNQKVFINAPCFNSTTITSNWQSEDTVKIEIEAWDKTSLFCVEHYLITTLLNLDIKTIFLPGKTTIEYKLTNSTEIELAKNHGIQFVRLCDEWFRVP